MNVDIVRHKELPNLVTVDSVYRSLFADSWFDIVLSSHTMEHLSYPARFDDEHSRVAKRVIHVLPPIRDLAAALDIREHRWLFLTVRKVDYVLPPRVSLPLARPLQARIGQKITA